MEWLAIGTKAVVGLTQTADKIVCFLSSVKDAPSIVRSLLAVVRSMTVIFPHLNTFITDSENRHDASTSSDIIVDNLAITVTGCVCLFSKLEALPKGCSTDELNRPWDRARWAAK